MDARYFLKSRTALIRFFYEESAKAFAGVQRRITAGDPPFDNPPWNDDGEPAFLQEWLDAQTATEMLGTTCIAMLSDWIEGRLEHAYEWKLRERGRHDRPD